MPDDMENAPGDRRWRSAETFQGLLENMDEFRRSPEGQQLQAAQQAAEADLQAWWLADQPGVVVGRHGGQVPEQWEGQIDGHNFYFRERGGDWDIELDLHEQQQPSITRRDLIATGTITAPGYGQSPRERAAFIVTTIRNHLRHTWTAGATASSDYVYRVEWSPADNEFVGLAAEFPSLSWLATTAIAICPLGPRTARPATHTRPLFIEQDTARRGRVARLCECTKEVPGSGGWGISAPKSPNSAGALQRTNGLKHPPNTKVTNQIWFVTSMPAVQKNCSLWAKGDLNPHVPKDTGT